MTEAQRANVRNYIYYINDNENYLSLEDPLTQLLIRTPVMANYKETCEDLSEGLTLDGTRYYSFQHQALFVLLHKLGLRGRNP